MWTKNLERFTYTKGNKNVTWSQKLQKKQLSMVNSYMKYFFLKFKMKQQDISVQSRRMIHQFGHPVEMHLHPACQLSGRQKRNRKPCCCCCCIASGRPAFKLNGMSPPFPWWWWYMGGIFRKGIAWNEGGQIPLVRDLHSLSPSWGHWGAGWEVEERRIGPADAGNGAYNPSWGIYPACGRIPTHLVLFYWWIHLYFRRIWARPEEG